MVLQVKVEGLAQLINQLEKFSPEVSKILKKELRQGADNVAKAARGLYPSSGLSNWGMWTADGSRGGKSSGGRDLGYIGSWARKGVKVQTNRYRRTGVTTGFGYDVVQTTPMGAIYELMGAGSGNMARNMNAAHPRPAGKKPRAMFPAYYEGMPAAQEQIQAAIRKAETEVGR
jgi:hypothetical protein